MKVFKLILILGAALIICSCAYNKLELIPMPAPKAKGELGKPLSIEAGLLIDQQTREKVFQSRSHPDFMTDYAYGVFEPYQLPVGQVMEEASVQIFSRMFQKVHLIRSLEEGKKYPLIIQVKLDNFDMHLRYASIYANYSYQTRIYASSRAKVSGVLKIQDREIWQNSAEIGEINDLWFDEYYPKEKVGEKATETITLAVGKLALIMAEESRKPQAVRGWLFEVEPGSRPETKK